MSDPTSDPANDAGTATSDPRVPGPGIQEMAEMHHRFANVLQSVRALLGREARSVGDDRCTEAFARADAQLHAFALLHERLRPVDGVADAPHACCAAFLQDVCRDLAEACLRPRGLRLDCAAGPPVVLPERTCRQLALLVTELVLNASKHAFGARGSGVVTVGFGARPDGGWRLLVADDGVGLPPAAAPGRGDGLRFVGMLARSLGTRCIVATGSAGTSYTFQGPVLDRVPVASSMTRGAQHPAV